MSSESKETFVARCRNKNKCSVALQTSDTSTRTSHVSNNTEAYPGSKRGKRGPHLIQNDDRYLHATLQLCVCVLRSCLGHLDVYAHLLCERWPFVFQRHITGDLHAAQSCARWHNSAHGADRPQNTKCGALAETLSTTAASRPNNV